MVGNRCAFAALTNDNEVIAWGDELHGGVIPADVSESLFDVEAIYSSPNRGSFTALTKKGKVIFWGQNKGKFDATSHHMDSNVLSVYFYKNNQLNAIKSDGVRITLD